MFIEALWTVTHQAPLSMGFPRQEYWSGLPFPPPGKGPILVEKQDLVIFTLGIWIIDSATNTLFILTEILFYNF